MNIDITHYLDSWATYHIECTLRARNRAKLNADGWRKLRQYHLEQYVKSVESPFFFMFALKFQHQRIYKQIACANEVYRVTLKKRELHFEEKRYGRESKEA